MDLKANIHDLKKVRDEKEARLKMAVQSVNQRRQEQKAEQSRLP